jgi:hypothetical protein
VTMAAGLGVTPLAAAGLMAVAVTALVNYGVSHVAEVKNLNGLVSTWWPQIEATYPGNDGHGPTNVSNINK